jgi:hypothetical protein
MNAEDIDPGRREALTRLGLGASVAYAAPVLLTLMSSARAGVVVGDGDLDNHNDKGGSGGGSPGSGTGKGRGGHIGQNRRRKPKGGGERMSLQELLQYIADFAKGKTK